MTKVLSKIENLIFLVIVIIILILNIYGSIFMLASYWPCLDKNMVFPFIVSLLVTVVLIYIYIYKIKLSKKIVVAIIVLTNIIGLIFRFILNRSFDAYPTSDQWQTLNCLNAIINNNDYSSLNKGAYFGIYPHLFLLILPMYLPVKLFGYNALYYYDLNAILIVASFIFIILFINKATNSKTALFVSILLNLFVPGYFLDFVVYGDAFSLFFISLMLLALCLKNQKIKILFSSLLIGFAYICRSQSIVWAIAFIIAYLVYKRISFKSLIVVSISLIITFTPKTLINIYFQNKLQIDFEKYSLPTSAWVYIGTSYNLENNAGIYNSFALDTLKDLDYNHDKADIAIKEGIKNNINKFMDIKELFLFVKRKIQNTWCDPDFETMCFVMPNSGYDIKQFVEEGYRLPVGVASEGATYTNTIGEFVFNNFTFIRILEKIYMFIVLIISAFASFIRNKRNEFNKYALFLQLNTVGFFLLQLFIETKPRYVLISFILVIVYAPTELFYISIAINKVDTDK